MAADIGKALKYEVLQNAGVVAVIAQRFYPLHLPQVATFPAATYQFIGGTPAVKEHGVATSFPRPRVQITCWSTDYAEIVAVDKAIKTAIDGRRGNWGTGSFVTSVQSCQAETVPRDDRDPETGLYWLSRDYFIMWKE